MLMAFKYVMFFLLFIGIENIASKQDDSGFRCYSLLEPFCAVFAFINANDSNN